MKIFVKVLPLLFIASAGFSGKILLKDKAQYLEPNGDYYSFPYDYHRPASDYHFVFVGGTYRVCSLNLQPKLANLDMLNIQIELGEQKFVWYCYIYDPRFFEIDF